MYDRLRDILATSAVGGDDGNTLGHSREGRPIRAFRFGKGTRRISLLAGCHADEPVGPRLLRHLAAFLQRVSPDDPMLGECEWWVLPHINPDGEERNRAWADDADHAFDLASYLGHVVRELPGDDIEFGFPRDAADVAARPENHAAYAWWSQADGPFTLHVSLHGMGFAAGPWFLLDEAWRERCDHLKSRCATRVDELGYVLHDVERRGEKGFVRLGRGFCTRPDSRNMRRYFLERGDSETAEQFRPSSMETIRSLGGDPLTVVSEMPLFITPGVGETLGPPDPAAGVWKQRINEWRTLLSRPGDETRVRVEAQEAGLRPMPIRDQLLLQWTLIVAALEQVSLTLASERR